MSALRTLRIARNLSQAEVAEAVGVTAGLIGQMERGDRRGSVETVRRLAAFFGVPMDVIAAEALPAAFGSQQGTPAPNPA